MTFRITEVVMGREVTLFAQWLESKGITLTDYANRHITEKVRLQDEYDAQSWAEKSRAAAVEAAKVPENFFVWLQGAHGMDQAGFDALSAQQQARLADTHSYALVEAKKSVEVASK